MLNKKFVGSFPRISRFFLYLKERGVWETLQIVMKNLMYEVRGYVDRSFDRRFGTDTSGIVETSNLDLPDKRLREAVYYEPTPWRVFRKMLRESCIDPSDYVFIDYGSGKGRTLLMASEYPFRKIMGVELSSSLNEIAIKNVQTFNKKINNCKQIEIFTCDAARFELPNGNIFIFFYSPFKLSILKQVNERIIESLHRENRKIVIFLYTSWCDHANFLYNQNYISECKELKMPYVFSHRIQRRLFRLTGGC